MSTFAYAGKMLRVDLSSRRTGEVSTLEYADRYLGGRGIAARVYWDEVSPEIGAFDPDNRLIFASGPLCGLPAIAGSRWEVCGKGPGSPHRFSYSNLGGRWGADLKFAGYDGIIVHGKSEAPVYLLLQDGTVEFRDASALWGTGAIDTREALKKELGSTARVVAIGPAGENLVATAIMLADGDSSGSGGLGASMGAKRLKAVVVTGGKGRRVRVAQRDRLKELTDYFRDTGRGFWEYLSRWSKDPILGLRLVPGPEMKKEPCYGCLGRCPRKVYKAANGQKGKFYCGSAMYYQPWAEMYYGDWNDVPFYATKLCDNYGLDAFDVDLMLGWLDACARAGILTEAETGLPLSKIGSYEFIESLITKLALRQGFGDVLARGVFGAADALGRAAKEQTRYIGYQAQPGLYPWYGPKLNTINAIPHAMEPRIPMQHLHEVNVLISKWVCWAMGLPMHVSSDVFRAIARRFWGSEMAVDFSTIDGKALAARMIQDRQYVKESLILCDFIWPITDLEFSQDHVGDPSLESKLLSAATGDQVSEEELYTVGERVFNLQRAILAREGHRGRQFDVLPDTCHTVPLDYDHSDPECLVPGKDGEVLSRKGAVLTRGDFEKLKDEYYRLRGWDVATGLQTAAVLSKLGLEDVARDLAGRGLLGK